VFLYSLGFALLVGCCLSICFGFDFGGLFRFFSLNIRIIFLIPIVGNLLKPSVMPG